MRQRKEAARPAAVAHEEQAGAALAKEAKDSTEKEAQRSRLLAACGLLSLLSVRLASSALNTVHDCDEVFNYWEPLHFLLHGSGLQTWENSPQFALRSYLYLLLHAALLLPARALLGSAAGKRVAFHALRAALGAACAAAETALCLAAARVGGRRLGLLLWLLLLTGSGMFTSATTFLPSTFTMVAFAFAAALSLRGRRLLAVAVCVAGGLIGWPFAGLAAVPLGLHALASAGMLPTAATVLGTAVCVMLPSAAMDRLFYGQATVSVWNLIRYNVAGGGESARYGTEGPLFYLLNTFNAFNLALPLALGAPLAELCAAYVTGRRPRTRLLLVLSSLYLWLGTMSVIPHKEERFMYVIYPQVCVGAALALDAVCEAASCRAVVRRAPRLRRAASAAVAVAVTGIAVLSAFRTAAVVGNYSAPMRVFAQLPAADGADATTLVCVGAEWHRFPSSFYLPGRQYRLGFVKTSFSGLLPLPFNASAGGTAHAPAALNDENREVAGQYVRRPGAECAYWVGLVAEAPPAGAQWSTVAEAPFLDAARSPALWRAFHVPLLSARRNTYTKLQLLKARR